MSLHVHGKLCAPISGATFFFLGAAPHPHPQEYMAIVVHHGGHRWITDGGSNVLDNTGGEGGSGLQRIHPHVSAEAVYPLDHTWLLWCTTAGTAGLRMEAQMY